MLLSFQLIPGGFCYHTGVDSCYDFTYHTLISLFGNGSMQRGRAIFKEFSTLLTMNGRHRLAELVSTIRRAVSVGVPLVKGASRGSVKVLKPLQINQYKPKIENFYQISIHCSLDRVRQSDCFSFASQKYCCS